MGNLRFALSLLLMYTGFYLCAQNLVERTVCIFDFQPLSDSETSYKDICADTVAIELERIGYLLVPNEKTRADYTGNLRDETAMVSAAKNLNADVAVFGFYIIESNSIRIGIKAYDILTGLPAVAVAESGLAGIEVFETIDSISAAVAKRIREALAPLAESEITIQREKVRIQTTVVETVVEQGIPVALSLHSPDDGAMVYAGASLLGTVADGVLILNTKAGAKLNLTLVKKGYYDKSVLITVSKKKPKNTLPAMIHKTQQELDLLYLPAIPMGIIARYSWFPVVDIFAVGGAAGLQFVPYSDSTVMQAAQGGIFRTPFHAHTTFYPLAIFNRSGWLRAYVRGIVCGEAYFTGESSGADAKKALTFGGGYSLGASLPLGRIRLVSEVTVLAPPFFHTGASYYATAAAQVQWYIGAGYVW